MSTLLSRSRSVNAADSGVEECPCAILLPKRQYAAFKAQCHDAAEQASSDNCSVSAEEFVERVGHHGACSPAGYFEAVVRFDAEVKDYSDPDAIKRAMIRAFNKAAREFADRLSE